MIGHSRRHRWRTWLPHLRGAPAVGRLGNQQRLTQAGMHQHEVMVGMEHRQLMLQAVLALALRVDPAPDRRHPLTDI